MNKAAPECPACRLLQAQIAMLEAEIGNLRGMVQDLTREETGAGQALEIIGAHVPQRITITGPVVSGEDTFYRVSLTHCDDLCAKCTIAGIDAARFLKFFDDLAEHSKGWDGEKSVESDEHQLA